MKRPLSYSLAYPALTSLALLSLVPYANTAFALPPSAPKSDSARSDSGLAKDDTTEINVKNADIGAIVKIFSKKTGRNYLLDEKVKGKVSIFLPGKVTSTEALRILESVLSFKGFTSVPIGDNLWKIVPSREARQSTIPTKTESPVGRASAAVVTRLINLKFVGADEMKQLISQLISPDGLITAYTGTNSLLIIDSEDNIQRLVDLVNILDVPLSDRDMTIIPIKNAEAKDIADKLNEILGTKDASKEGSGGSGSGEGSSRARLNDIPSGAAARGGLANLPGTSNGSGQPAGGGGGSAITSATVQSRSREPKIIADERTNSIIILADEDTTARIQALVSQLDSKVDLSGLKFYVYRCQHAKADELAQVLSGLAGGSGGGSSSGSSSSGFGSSSSRGGGLGGDSDTFGSSSSSRGSSRFGGSSGGLGGSGFGSSMNSSRSSGGSDRSRGPSSVSFGDKISITADPATNSLIISAGKQDYLKIKQLLDNLDIKRRQVLVEAMLLEVAVDNSLDLSTTFVTSAGGADGGVVAKNDLGGNLASFLSDPSKVSGFSIAAASRGSLKLPNNITIPTQTILLNAAKSNTNVNVLSAPTLLTTDNEEASIVVGQNVPFLASTSTSETNLNNTFNQVDRKDVGITLKLTPQISSGDIVTLRIFTEVSNVVKETLTSNLGPTTTVRTSETTVITKDSQMIAIGGLMSDDLSESEAGVPFLKDVPVLGTLFRNRSEGHRKTNLLIFITPRIVQDQYDARDVTLSKRDRLEGEIYAQDIYPRREEVLRNSDLDRVSEGQRHAYDGEKPSTITPPKETESSTTSSTPSAGRDDAIELHIHPKDADPNSAPRAMLKESQPSPNLDAQTQGDLFVVFSPTENMPSSGEAKVPFEMGASTQVSGVVIPGESNPNAKQFFRTGEGYAYRSESQNVPLRVAGIFNSQVEAEKMFGAIESWYTLSPHELMNLGRGPWISGSTSEAP